ncbi:myelin regulatory factor, partial [Aplysia californica]|uniref:Myelin regulatory factor n=1 Tax=Aplysia californica TaxID=6500 RepID=A0ABM1A7E6_APLCA
QQQQQQQQQNSSFCSISGQPQLSFDVYDHSQLSHTSLPDSPPDSEPYSPDGNRHQHTMNDLKSTLQGSMPSIPQSMYLNHNNRLGGMQANKAPPAYIGEPPKLSHHHPGAQLQQQQQQQQNQRLPLQFSPNGVAMGQQMPHHVPTPMAHPILPAHMGSLSSLNQACKKRKYSESPTGTVNPAMLHGISGVINIKQEPPGVQVYMGDCSGDNDFQGYDVDANGQFVDSAYQVLKWQPFNQAKWATLTNAEMIDLASPEYRVDADKGFIFSTPDEAFVCQKKNHFQVTVHMRLNGHAKYVRTPERVTKIDHFYLHFYGVKMESQNQQIKIEQSQSDRSKKSFHPVQVDLTADKETKVTVGRLHFNETTNNNMRKKGKPNPDQRYFLLVVSLHAHSGDSDYMIVGSVSDRIIVRASNPGQFDSDVDIMWQKGQSQDSIYHMGRIGINTDHPDEALTVHGSMALTGKLTKPSDIRAKEDIQEIDPKNQLANVSKLRIYRYKFKEEYAEQVGIPPDHREDTGVLAQEVLDTIPDAVQETGDVVLSNGDTIENFLVVDKDRIYMENVGAVKELCALTCNLEVRIDQLEKMNKRLGKVKRFDSFKSTSSSMSSASMSTQSTVSSVVPKRVSTSESDRSRSPRREQYKREAKSRRGDHSSSPSEKENKNSSLCVTMSRFFAKKLTKAGLLIFFFLALW